MKKPNSTIVASLLIIMFLVIAFGTYYVTENTLGVSGIFGLEISFSVIFYILIAILILWTLVVCRNFGKDSYRIGKLPWATIYKVKTPFLFYFLLCFNLFLILSIASILIIGVTSNPSVWSKNIHPFCHPSIYSC